MSDARAVQIDVFAPGANGNVAPARVISGPLTRLGTGIAELAADASGDIFVEQGNAFGLKPFHRLPSSVIEFAAGANGNVAPIGGVNMPSENWNAQSVSVSGSYMYVTAISVTHDDGFVLIYRLPRFKLIEVLHPKQFERPHFADAAFRGPAGDLHVLMKAHTPHEYTFAPDPQRPGEFLTQPIADLSGPKTGFDNDGAENMELGP